MATKELSLKNVSEIHSQLKRINNQTYVSLVDLAKEMSVKKTDLLSFIDKNPTHFVLKTLDKKPLLISRAFEDDADNVANKDKYVAKRKSLNEKVLTLSEMNNYGSISGYYIEPSRDLEREYLNTIDKVMGLKDKFDLKPALYYIGGFGDSSTLKPENGYQVFEQHVNELLKEGWTIKPDPSKLQWNNN